MNRDGLFLLGGLIGAITAAFAVALLTVNAGLAYQCRNYARMTGSETRWVTLDSCYIKTTTGWQRWDEYIARSVTNQ